VLATLIKRRSKRILLKLILSLLNQNGIFKKLQYKLHCLSLAFVDGDHFILRNRAYLVSVCFTAW